MSFGEKFVQRVDNKDFQILEILRCEGRISNKDLAALVGLSNSACLERVRRLERIGAIRGYHARVAPNVLETPFEILANIRLLDLPPETRRATQVLISSSRDVVAAFEVSGAFDCVIHFAAKEPHAWKSFCADLLAVGVAADRVSFGLVVDRFGGIKLERSA